MKILVIPLFLFLFLSSVAFERGLFVLFLSENGFTSWQISFLQISLFLSSLISEIPTGLFADRYGRKLSLQVGTLLMAVSVYGQYLSASSFWFMATCFIFHGVSFAFVSGSFQALLYDQLTAMGKIQYYLKLTTMSRFLISLALGASIFLGGILKEHSWQLVYLSTAVILITSLIFLIGIKEPNHQTQLLHIISVKKLTSEARLLLPIIIPFSLMHAAMTPYFVYSQKLFLFLGMNTTNISTVIASSEIISGLLSLGLVTMHNRWQAMKTAPVLLLVMAGLLFINLYGHSLVGVLAFVLCSCITLFLQSLSTDYIQTKITDSRLRASALSIMSFADAIAIGLAYLGYGFLFSHYSPAQAIAFTMILPLLAAIQCWLKSNQTNPPPSH